MFTPNSIRNEHNGDRVGGLKIAINTGGGDAPGLNAVIEAVVMASAKRGWEVQRGGWTGGGALTRWH